MSASCPCFLCDVGSGGGRQGRGRTKLEKGFVGGWARLHHQEMGCGEHRGKESWLGRELLLGTRAQVCLWGTGQGLPLFNFLQKTIKRQLSNYFWVPDSAEAWPRGAQGL